MNKTERIGYNLMGVNHESVFTQDKSLRDAAEKGNAIVAELQKKAADLYTANGAEGLIVGFKNGNAFLDGGINIKTPSGDVNNYMAYPVYMNNNIVYDDLNGYPECDVYDYLNMLRENNPKLRIDPTMYVGKPWDKKIEYWLGKLNKRK